MSPHLVGVTHGNFSPIQLNDQYIDSCFALEISFETQVRLSSQYTPVNNGTSCIIALRWKSAGSTRGVLPAEWTRKMRGRFCCPEGFWIGRWMNRRRWGPPRCGPGGGNQPERRAISWPQLDGDASGKDQKRYPSYWDSFCCLLPALQSWQEEDGWRINCCTGYNHFYFTAVLVFKMLTSGGGE